MIVSRVNLRIGAEREHDLPAYLHRLRQGDGHGHTPCRVEGGFRHIRPEWHEQGDDVTVVNTAKKRARTKSRWLDASTISSSGSFRTFIDDLRLLMKSAERPRQRISCDGQRPQTLSVSDLASNDTLDDIIWD